MLRAISPESQRAALQVNSTIFRAFLNCPRKAYLLLMGQAPQNAPADPDRVPYRRAALQHYQGRPAFTEQSLPRKSASAASESDRSEEEISIDDPACLIVDVTKVPEGGKRSKILHVPLLAVPNENVSKHDKFLLAFTARCLDKKDEKAAPFGRVIHGPAFTTARVQLKVLDRGLRKPLNDLAGIVDGTSTPRLFLNPHCNVCVFKQHCRAQAVETDDLSLLSTLSRKEVLSLNKRGILTVTQLSYLHRPKRGRRERDPAGKQRPFTHLPALKALSIREKKIYVKEPPELPKRKVDVFLDVEGLPDDGFYYLIGVIVRDGVTETTHSFWADTPADELRIWSDFLSLMARLADYSVFHYGSYEAVWFKAMLERHGTRTPAVAKAVGTAMVNVLTWCYQHIYFPTYSNGLKDIAGYLGYRWDERGASGMDSVQWRQSWEKDQSSATKLRLTRYNEQDCEALRALTGALRTIIDQGQAGDLPVTNAGDARAASPYGLGKNKFVFPELDYINKCAYFDYQREKIYWRTDENVKKISRRTRARGSYRYHRVQATVHCRARSCIECKDTDLRPVRTFGKVVNDLKFGRTGVKVWIVKYVGHRYLCHSCGVSFFPRTYPKWRRAYGHGVLAWIVYHKIELRQTNDSVRRGLNDLFGFGIEFPIVSKMKPRASEYYGTAYREIVVQLQRGRLVHVDETKVYLSSGSGYVWVFTNLEEVLYVYSNGRDGRIVGETLGNFGGVLVSDFYSAYDSFDCKQQRCLVHLIRDINDDLLRNPFSPEFKVFVHEFSVLLKAIIDTVDRHGLKRRFLGKHKKDVAHFFRGRIEPESKCELIQRYQERFRRNEGRLFTFLDHDGVPWNNNNAENAIKAFAALRKGADGLFTEKGLQETLRLLSISQTLKNKDKSFLNFLKSGKRSLIAFCES